MSEVWPMSEAMTLRANECSGIARDRVIPTAAATTRYAKRARLSLSLKRRIVANLESRSNPVKKAHSQSMPKLRSPWTAFLLLAALAPSPALADGDELSDRDQSEEGLNEKYEHGDYGFYFSVHDPWDVQYDQRSFGEVDEGSLAYPFGF